MAVKDIDKAEDAALGPLSAEEQARFAHELSLIREELARLEATAQQAGSGFDWQYDRSKSADRRSDEPAQETDASDKHADDPIESFREEMRAEFTSLHSKLRNLLYQETTDLRLRLARAEARLAVQRGFVLSPAKRS